MPPFVKKALDGPGSNETEGPFSARTLEMLAGSNETLHVPVPTSYSIFLPAISLYCTLDKQGLLMKLKCGKSLAERVLSQTHCLA